MYLSCIFISDGHSALKYFLSVSSKKTPVYSQFSESQTDVSLLLLSQKSRFPVSISHSFSSFHTFGSLKFSPNSTGKSSTTVCSPENSKPLSLLTETVYSKQCLFSRSPTCLVKKRYILFFSINALPLKAPPANKWV